MDPRFFVALASLLHSPSPRMKDEPQGRFAASACEDCLSPSKTAWSTFFWYFALYLFLQDRWWIEICALRGVVLVHSSHDMPFRAFVHPVWLEEV